MPAAMDTFKLSVDCELPNLGILILFWRSFSVSFLIPFPSFPRIKFNFSGFLKLTKNIADIAIEKEKIFRENPFHPSLRLHELKGNLNGLWSISVNLKYRIIFKYMKNGDILFISIGKHDIYRDL